MRTRITIGAALLLLLSLGGCATGQLDRDAVFTRSSPTSLVMFGVDVQSQFKAPDFVFGRYDAATGKVDSSKFYHATPTFDQLTGGQKLGEYMTGRDPRPVRHLYFVINLPRGDWFLWRVSAVHGDGAGTMFSGTTVLSDGTILIDSKPGTALYIGEFVLTGKYGEGLTLTPTDRNFDAAAAELDKFGGVQVKLVDDEVEVRSFECAKGPIPRRECDPTQIVLSR